jgi:hypothetical protein
MHALIHGSFQEMKKERGRFVDALQQLLQLMAYMHLQMLGQVQVHGISGRPALMHINPSQRPLVLV